MPGEVRGYTKKKAPKSERGTILGVHKITASYAYRYIGAGGEEELGTAHILERGGVLLNHSSVGVVPANVKEIEYFMARHQEHSHVPKTIATLPIMTKTDSQRSSSGGSSSEESQGEPGGQL